MRVRQGWSSALEVAKRDRYFRAIYSSRRVHQSEVSLSTRVGEANGTMKLIQQRFPGLVNQVHRAGGLLRCIKHLDTETGSILVSITASGFGVSWSVRGCVQTLVNIGLRNPMSPCPAVFDYESRGRSGTPPESGVATLVSTFGHVSDQIYFLAIIEKLVESYN